MSYEQARELVLALIAKWFSHLALLKKLTETHSNERALVGFFPLTPNTSGRERCRLLAVGYVGRIPLLGLSVMPFTCFSRPKGFQPSALHL